MRKKLFYILILCTAAASLFSCKKDSSEPDISNYELLAGRKWQLTNLYYEKIGDEVKSDYTSFYYEECELDDLYEFKTDNSLERSVDKRSVLSQPNLE